MTVLHRKNYPFRTLTIAADARLCRTNYADDQVWELRLGETGQPAMGLFTKYGGRVELASLLPTFSFDGRTVAETQTFVSPPVIAAFAPNYVLVEGELTGGLRLEAEYWVMESNACGARFTLFNTTSADIALHVGVSSAVTVGEKPADLAVLTLADGGNALLLGKHPRLQPVVLLENGHADSNTRKSARVIAPLNVPAGGSASVRWVHGGADTMQNSLHIAHFWLAQDWDAAFTQIALAAQSVPLLDSGDPELDNTVALSYQYLLQSFINATDKLPYPSVVGRRTIATGYSAAGDGSDYDRSWGGVSIQTAYLVALSAASIAPELSKGLIYNYLAIQQRSGSIDARPGLGGQRAGYDVAPLLARLTWRIFRYTGDTAFLKKTLPKLMLFYRYYMQLDSDYLPQWVDEKQMGYPYFPTFAVGQSWAQNADINRVECIDMATYLLSEGLCLSNIARYLKMTEFDNEIQRLLEHNRIRLDDLWRRDRYQYRDHQTRKVNKPQVLLTEARGDEAHFITAAPERPSRLIVRITGGTDRAPKCQIHIDGLDKDGKTVTETADTTRIRWFRGYGVFTTDAVFKQVDRIHAEGLSRVMQLSISTIDHTRMDITTLLPLASMGGITQDRAARLVDLLTDPKKFWRPNGVSMVPATDENFDSSNQKGGGGIWLAWFSMLGEGLCDYGHVEVARDMLKRLLKLQTEIIGRDGYFHEFYDSDAVKGWGEPHSVQGIVPLHLLRRVLSIRILSNSQVWTGDRFVWGNPVTVRQHGVVVARSDAGTRVEFPSGTVVELPADAEWQLITDPQAEPPMVPQRFASAEIKPEPSNTGRVVIQVEIES